MIVPVRLAEVVIVSLEWPQTRGCLQPKKFPYARISSRSRRRRYYLRIGLRKHRREYLGGHHDRHRCWICRHNHTTSAFSKVYFDLGECG